MTPRKAKGALAATSQFPAAFLRDLIDRGAGTKKERAGAGDRVAGFATVLTSVLALVDVVRKAAGELLGMPAVLVQTLLLVVSIAGCIHIISARRGSSPTSRPTYRFGTAARTTARSSHWP